MTNSLAKRLEKLGTETAFSVSLDTAEFAQSGKMVYPFHLGDLDISTPRNIIEATYRAMLDGKTGYNPAQGLPELRELLAETVGNERGIDYDRHNIAIQPGGKPVITKFIQTLMNPGDSVLYPNPGYPIYESQINYHGGKALPYGYISNGNGFKINREELESKIDSQTKILIYNNYQNPMGAESEPDEMDWLAELAHRNDLWVLSDEAYFKIRYSGESRSIASLPGMSERTVILYTFSKTYAMTGWRLGAAIGPKNIIAMIAKLNVNDESCSNHFIQYGGMEALQGDQSEAKEILAVLKKRRDVLYDELRKIEGVKLGKPETTFYLFPDITDIFNKSGAASYEEFRIDTLKETGVSFCTREHFGTLLKNEDRKFIRFAYSGITVPEIFEGITMLKNYWNQVAVYA